MSEAMAQKKKEEIETVEAEIDRSKKMIEGDVCPLCGSRPTSYPYLCYLPNPYGWLECASCGTVYAPLSVRRQKLNAAKSHVQNPNKLILES